MVYLGNLESCCFDVDLLDAFVFSAVILGILTILLFTSRPKPPANPAAIAARIRDRQSQFRDIKQEFILLKQDMADLLYWHRRSSS